MVNVFAWPGGISNECTWASVSIYAGHLWSCETVTQKVAVAIPYDE